MNACHSQLAEEISKVWRRGHLAGLACGSQVGPRPFRLRESGLHSRHPGLCPFRCRSSPSIPHSASSPPYRSVQRDPIPPDNDCPPPYTREVNTSFDFCAQYTCIGIVSRAFKETFTTTARSTICSNACSATPLPFLPRSMEATHRTSTMTMSGFLCASNQPVVTTLWRQYFRAVVSAAAHCIMLEKG